MALFDVNVTDIINRTPILKSKFDDYDKLKATYLKVEKYAKNNRDCLRRVIFICCL